MSISVHSPIKKTLFKLNIGQSEGTITASFQYGRITLIGQIDDGSGGYVSLTDVRRKVLSAFFITTILMMLAIYTPQGSHLVLLTP